MIRKLSKTLDARDKIQANKRRHIRNAPFSPLLKNKKERGGQMHLFFEDRNVRVRLKEKEQKMNKKYTYK